MPYLTSKQLPRRTFLRGVGATVALPFLDAMVPTGRLAAAAVAAVDTTRLVCIEEVHGLPGCNEWGATQHLFAPATTGKNFEMVPDNPLSCLADYQDQLTIISPFDAMACRGERSRNWTSGLIGEKRSFSEIIGRLHSDGRRPLPTSALEPTQSIGQFVFENSRPGVGRARQCRWGTLIAFDPRRPDHPR